MGARRNPSKNCARYAFIISRILFIGKSCREKSYLNQTTYPTDYQCATPKISKRKKLKKERTRKTEHRMYLKPMEEKPLEYKTHHTPKKQKENDFF